MNWKDFEAVIPAVMSIPERADSVKELLIQLAKQCPDIKVHVIPQWHPNGPNSKHGFESIRRGLEGLSKPWILYFEDDAELSPEFGEKALPIIEMAEDNCGAIAFFSCGVKDEQIYKSGFCLYETELPFTFSQGMAIRLEVAKAWEKELMPWWENATKPGYKGTPDMALGKCCYNMGKKILINLPNLVQHRTAPSAFGHDHDAKSRTFGMVLKPKYQTSEKRISYK